MHCYINKVSFPQSVSGNLLDSCFRRNDKSKRIEMRDCHDLRARNDKEDQIATPASTHWRTRNDERRLINQATTSAQSKASFATTMGKIGLE